MIRPIAKHRPSVLAALGLGLAAAMTLAGCGGSSSKTSASPTTTTRITGSKAGGSSPDASTHTIPGASGSVAAMSGKSIEVQSQTSGQTTVSWTTSTRFTETVTVSASSVAVGDCVTATGTSSGGMVKATTVSISQPTSGSCTTTQGAGGFGGAGFSNRLGGNNGAGSKGPKGTPPGGKSGKPPTRVATGKGPAGLANVSFADGKVTAVSGSKLVLSGYTSTTGRSDSSAKTTPTTAVTKTVKVAVSSSTSYSERKVVTSSKLAVGDCVSAVGSTSSTGAVKAKTVQITSTGHKSCTIGFGGPGATSSTSSPGSSSNG